MESNKSKTMVVHNGEFHADDVFAVATMKLLLGEEAVQVVRTRDDAIIEKADIVADVGGIYDETSQRFDHHQPGAAGKRANGITYAAFGLVWKTYGEKVAQSKEAADFVDQRLTQPIDAIDNGIPISKEVFPGVRPYDISSIIGSLNSDAGDAADQDKRFGEAVEFAKNILVREIESAKHEIGCREHVLDSYNKSSDKRIVVFEKDLPWEKVLSQLPEPLYAVYPKEGGWRIKAVRNDLNTFVNRKDLPKSWGGKRGTELSEITGVPGGVFCHNALFMAAAETKEAALAMAKIAVQN